MFESMELSLPQPAQVEADEVARAKARDESVWTAWYDRYFPVLYRYALARTGLREDAEDIAAQSFVRALEGIERYHYRGKPVLAWLYRIAHNLITDRVRRQKRRAFLPLSDTDGRLAVDDERLPRVELMDALYRLKPEHREVLALRYLAALSNREVAAVLGKTETAVYSLQVRAAASLRKALSDGDQATKSARLRR